MNYRCNICKKSTGTVGGAIHQAKNGRMYKKGKCADCGRTKCCFTSGVEGGNFLKKAEDYVTKNLLETAPAMYKYFLKETKGKKITQIALCRKALSDAFHLILKKGTPEHVSKRLLAQDHGKLYHLWSNWTLDDGSKWLVEKNERLNMKKGHRNDGPCHEQVITFNPPVDANQFMKNAEQYHIKKHGDLSFFFRYRSTDFNCQYFIQNMLDANGVGDQHRKFVSQSVQALNDAFLSKIVKVGMDWQGFSNWVQNDLFRQYASKSSKTSGGALPVTKDNLDEVLNGGGKYYNPLDAIKFYANTQRFKKSLQERPRNQCEAKLRQTLTPDKLLELQLKALLTKTDINDLIREHKNYHRNMLC